MVSRQEAWEQYQSCLRGKQRLQSIEHRGWVFIVSIAHGYLGVNYEYGDWTVIELFIHWGFRNSARVSENIEPLPANRSNRSHRSDQGVRLRRR